MGYYSYPFFYLRVILLRIFRVDIYQVLTFRNASRSLPIYAETVLL